MKRITLLVPLILLIFLPLGVGPLSLARAAQLLPKRDEPLTLEPGQAVEGQLLVKFEDAPTIAYESELALTIPFTSLRIQLREAGFAVRGNRAATNVTKKLRVQEMRVLGQSDVAREIALVQLPEDGDEQAAIEQYENTSGVEIAEPNYLMSALFTPNDPYFQRTTGQDYQWNLHNIRMPEAWDVPPQGGSPSVKVAVIDSGVAFATHTVDGTQFVQAPELSGVTFIAPKRFESLSGDCQTPLPTPVVDDHPHDQVGHGTHVTSTIVQATNNAQHAAGIAFNTSIIPVKVLTACTSGPYTGEINGVTSDVIAGINHAVANGAHVINMSIGSPSDSTLLHQSIIAAVNAGATVVAASGNEATRTSTEPIVFPAAYPEVVAVGASRFDGKRAEYSSYGPELDLLAPGGQVYTDWDLTTIAQCVQNAGSSVNALLLCYISDQNTDFVPDGVVQQTVLQFNPTQFTSILPPSYPAITQFRCIQTDFQTFIAIDERCGVYNGTSMATPHVSAAAALIRSVNQNLTPAQVKDFLTSTASKTAIPGYTQTEHGAGLLDVMAALLAASGGTITPPVSTPTPTPGGPTATPPPSQGINWNTKTLSFHADSVVITANGTTFTAPVTGVTVHSDPGGPTYTTLEATWFDAGTEMRLNMYFKADANKWWVTEARTYGGADPGKWIYYTDPATLAPFTTVLGSTLTLPNVTLVSDTGSADTGTVTMTNVSLKTKLGTTSENFQLLVGDVNDDNKITIFDVGAVVSKYTDFKVPVPEGTPEDVNADGFVTIEDVALVLLNYTDFSIPGDHP